MSDLKMHTANLVAKNIEKLTALFPNCITETRNEQGEIIKGVDFDLLRQELSEVLVEGEQERYTLNWVGKKESILAANAPIAKTLRPCREESLNFDTTENLFIEGDNLDALKLLQENYLGKVKMIYIDPPYNTGNDFIYNDDFAENTEEFLIRSNQIDEEGNRLIANTESNGRFHSDWLSMIYSRLRLARNLLTDDGVIFISIDDSEQANLKRLCDEIFGEKNFVTDFVWKSKLGKIGTTKTISTTHEYIICYSKNINSLEFKMIYTQQDGRKENLRQWGQADRREDRPSMFYPIVIDGISVLPIKEDGSEGRWRVGQDMAQELLANGELELVRRENKYQIYRKFPAHQSVTSYESLMSDSVGTTANGARVLNLLGLNKVFDYSKPIELIKFFTNLVNNRNALVLDFFAGSSTTSHAVMQLNAEDGGTRQFIMVQLPEETNKQSEAFKAGFTNIAEISKERIRRAGKKIQAENPDKKVDIGFRVLKIDSSNMKDIYYQPDQLDKIMLDHMVSHIKEDRTAEDLLFQVMLDWGIELSLPIERKTIDGSEVYFVAGNTLVACFDKFTMNVVDEIAKVKPLRVVSTELAIMHDQDKTNIKERFKQLSHDTEVRFL